MSDISFYSVFIRIGTHTQVDLNTIMESREFGTCMLKHDFNMYYFRCRAVLTHGWVPRRLGTLWHPPTLQSFTLLHLKIYYICVCYTTPHVYMCVLYYTSHIYVCVILHLMYIYVCVILHLMIICVCYTTPHDYMWINAYVHVLL